jgi:tricorn protease
MRGKTIVLAALLASGSAWAAAPESNPGRLLQQPALSRDLVAFVNAGDIWIAPRSGGRATRLTTGVGVESAPIFSPDGRTIAFTGDYDGNVDVYTIPATGGVPRRITWHPAADSAVGWSPDGRKILFRSGRDAASRYTQLYQVPAEGGVATRLPLPMAFSGKFSPDGATIAYNPLPPAFSFDFTNFTAWGNYRGGRAGAIWLTGLDGLDSVQVPHRQGADFSPVWAGGKLYFLSARNGPVGIFSYDPATKAVSEVYRNTSTSDIRSLASDGSSLVFDRMGELYGLTPGGQPQRLAIDVVGDMPDVRARIIPVAEQVENVRISPTGLRAVVEAHGEILTLPVKEGVVRNLTNSPGVMEREPAWSPDGQSIAYFSDEDGLYSLHVASQKGASDEGPTAVRKYKLAAEPAYYFRPLWSPDSKKIAFRDNRLNTWIVDLATGRMSRAGEPDAFGGFSAPSRGMAWSPDSNWLAYARTSANHMRVLMLHSLATGRTVPVTDPMATASDPAFDRNGKYLYFLASNNAGATNFGLDMTSDLYRPTWSVYALALAAGTASPVAPELNDEKNLAQAQAKAAEAVDKTPAGKKAGAPPPKPVPTAIAVDVADLPAEAIARRVVALPIPAGEYRGLQAGKPGSLYLLKASEPANPDSDGPPTATLLRWTAEDKKTDPIAENLLGFELSADAQKVLLATAPAGGGAAAAGGPGPRPAYFIASADKPFKPSDPDTRVKLETLQVRTDPAAEWAQMYREVWRIERAYFYDPTFHGYDTVAAERRLAPYVGAIQSRSDLNYLFQEMLTGFSIGHLRGGGGAIPQARRVSGGLLGADYVLRGNRWCISKIYDGGSWSPDAKAPLAQPGLNVRTGDCILSVNGTPVNAENDIQQPLEGLAGQAVVLRIAPASGAAPREVTVVPIPSEARLRNLDWIEGNRRKVAELSGGRLGYVYLPDTGGGGFASFNRYFFAQTDKDGVIVDERFNAGGQAADYVVEVLGRKLASWWQPRYGGIDRTPAGSILGPKVMIANEVSGSGGDMLPWMFRHYGLGPLVGKRTWGGLVGIGPIPVLMDGGTVTSPSVGFFSPTGQWDVENKGVEPDYVVEQDPRSVAAGHDPQLEAAVRLALEALAKSPPPSPQRPAFPVYGSPEAGGPH